MVSDFIDNRCYYSLSSAKPQTVATQCCYCILTPDTHILYICTYMNNSISLQLCAYNQSTLFNVYSIPSISNFTISISSSISLRLCSEYPTYNNVSKNPFDNLLRKLYSSSCRIAEVYHYGRQIALDGGTFKC